MQEIIRAIQGGLDQLDVHIGDSTEDWTKAVKIELCRIGREEFGLKVGASGVTPFVPDYPEWLYDVTWLKYNDDDLTDAVLVAECEWGEDSEIVYDFQKLLLARATLRLMIFDSGQDPQGSQVIAERLARQAGKFKRGKAGDGWLLAAWELNGENENGWSFRYFIIEPKCSGIFRRYRSREARRAGHARPGIRR